MTNETLLFVQADLIRKNEQTMVTWSIKINEGDDLPKVIEYAGITFVLQHWIREGRNNISAYYHEATKIRDDSSKVEMIFKVGDQVEKWTGDYQLSGEVRSVFMTKASKVRYVVEHDPGFLHIYSAANLRLL